jgi:hypothetical protein
MDLSDFDNLVVFDENQLPQEPGAEPQPNYPQNQQYQQNVQYQQPQPQYAPNVAQSYVPEVDRRLQKAQYYSLVLNEWIFGDDYSEPAQEVMSEFREFMVHKLNVLMGIEPEKTNLEPFTEDEVLALRLLAGNTLKNPKVIQFIAERQGAPQQPKRPVQVSKPKAPTLKRVNTPQTPQPQFRPPEGPPAKKYVAVPVNQQGRQLQQPYPMPMQNYQPQMQPYYPPQQPQYQQPHP